MNGILVVAVVLSGTGSTTLLTTLLGLSASLGEDPIDTRGEQGTIAVAVELKLAVTTLLASQVVAGTAVACVSKKAKRYGTDEEPYTWVLNQRAYPPHRKINPRGIVMITISIVSKKVGSELMMNNLVVVIV